MQEEFQFGARNERDGLAAWRSQRAAQVGDDEQALLDWLATEFAGRGWSVKSLHRVIVTSSPALLTPRSDQILAISRPAFDRRRQAPQRDCPVIAEQLTTTLLRNRYHAARLREMIRPG